MPEKRPFDLGSQQCYFHAPSMFFPLPVSPVIGMGDETHRIIDCPLFVGAVVCFKARYQCVPKCPDAGIRDVGHVGMIWSADDGRIPGQQACKAQDWNNTTLACFSRILCVQYNRIRSSRAVFTDNTVVTLGTREAVRKRSDVALLQKDIDGSRC
ncbi:hypothetical protein M8818_007100 [Zalaria obscura]|uniref:Uncharacterized protein n=1 Tax=Zalaria obscura TaxID=2024903 RepID=A0ACC3S707_9PEZI